MKRSELIRRLTDLRASLDNQGKYGTVSTLDYALDALEEQKGDEVEMTREKARDTLNAIRGRIAFRAYGSDRAEPLCVTNKVALDFAINALGKPEKDSKDTYSAGWDELENAIAEAIGPQADTIELDIIQHVENVVRQRDEALAKLGEGGTPPTDDYDLLDLTPAGPPAEGTFWEVGPWLMQGERYRPSHWKGGFFAWHPKRQEFIDELENAIDPDAIIEWLDDMFVHVPKEKGEPKPAEPRDWAGARRHMEAGGECNLAGGLEHYRISSGRLEFLTVASRWAHVGLVFDHLDAIDWLPAGGKWLDGEE